MLGFLKDKATGRSIAVEVEQRPHVVALTARTPIDPGRFTLALARGDTFDVRVLSCAPATDATFQCTAVVSDETISYRRAKKVVVE